MKKKQVKKIEWKSVHIDGNIFNDSKAEGLIGIEECTDYDLINTTGRKATKRKTEDAKASSKKKKGKIHETPAIETSNEDTVDGDNFDDVLAWTNFGLPQSILKALQMKGFTQPTQIQSLTLAAAILGRRDILGAAETGSGKTLAFGLPILTGILDAKSRNNQSDCNVSESEDSEDEHLENLNHDELGCIKVQKFKSTAPEKPLFALILTPTRELAVQIKNHLVDVAKFTGLHVAVVVGGMAAVKQERILSKCPEIVVATPGRLWELIQQGHPHLSQLENIKYLAIDETDRMLERGHFEELHDLLEILNQDETKKKSRQNFVFSATLTLVHELPKYLVRKLKKPETRGMRPEQKLKKIIDMLGITNPKIVDVTQGTGTSTTLTECRITCSIDEKDYYLYYFLQRHPGRTLIFCNSIGCVRRLANLLGLLQCHPLPLHASMQQRQRLKNLERFRDDDRGILVATDVAARGLDIPCVEHVLHYQTPRTSEGYVHRSGRTARASRQGITVLLMEPSEITNYIKLCRTLNKNEDLPIFPVQESYLKAVKERVNLARDLDKLQLRVKKTNSEHGWLQKAAKEMDIIVDDHDDNYDADETNSAKKVVNRKRKQLDQLLEKAVFPKGFSGKYPLASGNMETFTLENNETAVEIMKTTIEKLNETKKKSIALYKPRKRASEEKPREITLKSIQALSKVNKKRRNYKNKK